MLGLDALVINGYTFLIGVRSIYNEFGYLYFQCLCCHCIYQRRTDRWTSWIWL